MSFNRERFSAGQAKELENTKAKVEERNKLGKEGKSRGFVSGLASLLGSAVKSEAGLDKKQDLTKVSLSTLGGKYIGRNKRDANFIKGGVFDLTESKRNYGMDSGASVFYYGAGKNHYLASGTRIRPPVVSSYVGKRLFTGLR